MTAKTTGIGPGATAKAAMLRTGYTQWGAKLWTAEEDETCRRLAHDRPALAKALSHRTPIAIGERVRRLGLGAKLHWWTGAELARLRKFYLTASPEELRAAFPNVSDKSLHNAAWRLRLFRPKKPYKPTGDPLLDQIRQRCLDLDISLAALCRAVGNKDFLKLHQKRGRRRAALTRALNALDGELRVDRV
jgi:hypothetical protein